MVPRRPERAVRHRTEGGSQKVQHFFGGFKHESDMIQLTKVDTTEISTDLERGAAPRSIADEFSVVSTLVQKLQWCENRAFHFHAAPFGIRSQLPRSRRAKSEVSTRQKILFHVQGVGRSLLVSHA